jgi:hypothetical protein
MLASLEGKSGEVTERGWAVLHTRRLVQRKAHCFRLPRAMWSYVSEWICVECDCPVPIGVWEEKREEKPVVAKTLMKFLTNLSGQTPGIVGHPGVLLLFCFHE